MSLTDYYMFRRLAGTKAKTKFACIGSTKSYEPLEALRSKKKFKGSATMDAIDIGDLFAYICLRRAKFSQQHRTKSVTHESAKLISRQS